MKNLLKIKIVNKSEFPLPKYETDGAAGMDLRANIKESIELKPAQRMLISTGIYIDLPRGYNAEIRPRSGTAYKKGVTVLNSPGTIDYGYWQEVKVLLVNLSRELFVLEPGERIAQMVVCPVMEVVWNQVEDETYFENKTNRTGGFGSTGSK